ncbi:hypothetical protein ACLB2K_032435 [Fragaria x ananassa]
MAATCFWDTSSNTFNFKFGQIGITLLDLYAIIGLPIFDKPYQENDFEEEEVAFEADPNHHNFYGNDLMLNRMYPEALTNKFMWCTTHSSEAMHLFEQAISITDLRLPDDVGFELYAPIHFACKLGLQQEIPFPLFESVNMYTSWL